MERKLLAVLLVLGVLGAVNVWAFNHRTTGRIWKLSDGSELSFVRVTSGGRHEVVYGTRWRDKVYPLLPASLQSRLRSKLGSKVGASVAVHTSLNPQAVVVWFRFKPSALRPGASQGSPPCFIAMEDANGLEAGRQEEADSTFYLPKGDELQAWELREYPRRSSRFGIRIYQRGPGGETSPVGQLLIRNPLPQKRPGWVAEALPATRRTNELEISLAGLETGLKRRAPGSTAARVIPRGFSEATFRILERGQPTEAWLPAITAIADASGERRTGDGSIQASNGLVKILFEGGLWLEESAWKLTVKLSREAQFPPEETWNFRGVPVPSPRETTEINARTNLFGEQIEFLGLSAPHARLPPEWVSTQTSVNLHARTPVPLPGMHFTLAEVRDDQGRLVPVTGIMEEPSTMGRGATMRELNRAYALAIPDGARTLDITFALSRDYYVEFMAGPVMAK